MLLSMTSQMSLGDIMLSEIRQAQRSKNIQFHTETMPKNIELIEDEN